jgi:hypothetical protein
MKKLSNRTELDRQWEEAFKDAEMAPSEGVWDKIDSALSKEEAGYFKKKAFLYKLLAAASIAFALGVGMFSINYYLDRNIEQVSEQIIEQNEPIELPDNESALASENNSTNEGQQVVDSQVPNQSPSETSIPIKAENSEVKSVNTEPQVNVLLLSENEIVSDQVAVPDNSSTYFALNAIQGQGISMSSSEEMIYTIDHIYLIPIMPRGASKIKKEKESGVFLAGLDFSTGIFDPNFEVGGGGGAFASASPSFAGDGSSVYADAQVESLNNQLVSFNTMNKSFAVVRSSGKKPEPKIAFSYGANVGFKVTRRILLQTGIAYRKANTTTTTTGYIEESNSDARIPIIATYKYQFDGLATVNPISETNLNNEFEFLSIPLRAGYVFVDRKINVSLMAGISSEFYLNSNIEDKSNYLETLSISPGEGSPYKNVYFNGSLGTMIGYSFAEKYAVTVEPSYRFALNSFTRDDFYLNSLPSSFMLSFGVAYNFN